MLKFDSKKLEFSGIPDKEYLYSYEVSLCAYDLNKSICDYFSFKIENSDPVVELSIQK